MLGTCTKHNTILEYDPSTGQMFCSRCRHDSEWIKAEYEVAGWVKSICPLCGKPSPNNEVHDSCAEKENSRS